MTEKFPLQDDSPVPHDSLMRGLSKTKWFQKATLLERDVLTQVLEEQFKGNEIAPFNEVFTAMAEGIGYITKNKYNNDALKTVDFRLLDRPRSGVTETIAYTVLCTSLDLSKEPETPKPAFF